MPNYKLTIAYDGTDFCGFQVQPNGPTVQGELMRAAQDLFGMGVTVTAASRTDSGVHALGQVVVLKGEKVVAESKLPLALNMRLPDAIAVVGCLMVEDDWHPRYQTHRKTYCYKVYNGPYQYPFDKKNSYHCRRILDLDKMREACAILVGTHDFESYSSAKKSVEDTVRTIYNLEIIKDGDMLNIVVSGSGFLYNMVRIMVGTLLEVGYGRRDLDSIRKSLAIRDRSLTGITAIAKGLTLVRIDYGS